MNCAVTNLVGPAEFVRLVEQSNLLDEQGEAELRRLFRSHPDLSADWLAARLIQNDRLTAWQALKLLAKP